MTDRPVVVVDDRSAATVSLGVSQDALAVLMADVLLAEGVGSNAEAGLHLVDAPEMAELNARHMGSEGATDVLSFPVDGAGASAGAAPAEVGTGADRVASTGLVGDVVLCPQVAAAQAGEHAGSVADECRLLVVHGTLHLCGWDHGDEAGRKAMWERERRLLEDLGTAPALDPWSMT